MTEARGDDDKRAKIKIEIPLPCGHVLRHGVAYYASPAQARKIMARAANALAYWFEDRLSRHSCALVSQDNPNGTKPR